MKKLGELLDRPAVKWGAIAVVMMATWFALRLEGRRIWCKCRTPHAFIADAYSEHTSQHLLDPYSFSHVLHGVIFFWALAWLAPWASNGARLVVSTAIEAGWEILENSRWVIDRYRETTAALGYEGDSVVNSMGDVACCVAGYLLAKQIGWKWSIAVFFVVELGLLATIRDNLTLNVIMLLWPIEAIKNWQTAA